MTDAPIRILVVDDDPTARILFRAALLVFGYDVSLAAGGKEALRQFRAKPFDMVMLDIEMPGMNGHEVCVVLRQEADPLLPILMVTGMDDVASVEAAYGSGATDFISKPVNWALIGHRVKYLLRGHQTMLDLRTADARNLAILQAIPDLLFEVDRDGRYLDYHSPRADLLVAPAEVLLGKTVHEMLPASAAQVVMEALQEADIEGVSTGKQFDLALEHGVFWFELSAARKATEAGQRPHFIVLSRNITERKVAEQKILQLAMFDHLTGLPNRRSFLDSVEREISRARHSSRHFGVLFMDLDGFKNINDTMGHSAGDLALQLTADRLREAVRAADLVSRTSELETEVELARLGGDEFTALLLDIKSPEEAFLVARRILHLMRQPFMLNGLEVMLTASIGIALYTEDGKDASTLLKHADTAMYHAKDLGRDNCQFYSADLTEVAMHRLQIESDLRMALEHDEFSLAYQPQVDVESGCIQSVEALIRWQRPVHGTVLPQEFIAAAEHSGLIVPMGQWVLRTACEEAAGWQRAGMPLRVAVNLSPMQFKDPNLLQMVLDALAQSCLSADLLELEVTESAAMEDTAATLATLHAFRACGVRISLDDFGTGYSSLSYLTRMPFSNLKVDQSFVQGLPDDVESYAIVRAVLAMADSLGLSVTAEGVETLEQAQVLKAMNCDSLQGYYFSKPVPANEIRQLLAQRWTLDSQPHHAHLVPLKPMEAPTLDRPKPTRLRALFRGLSG
jgi:diguanylate cyclase (GGDEF)-like protein/PAS domain S-box-containing protein